MTNRDLPDFTGPPLVEAVLSIQFEELQELRTPHIGLYWATIKDRFPSTEEHAPIEPVIERIGIDRTHKEGFKISSKPILSRNWFIKDDGRELIQLQADRFIHNWRKKDPSDLYPRYESVRSTFVDELASFNRLLEKLDIGPIAINQCEVTYINHISANDIWSSHTDLDKVFTVFNESYSEKKPADLEDARFNLRYLLRNEDDEFLGRLHVSVKPAFTRSNKEPIFVMTLTARGKPFGEKEDNIVDFFDFGRAKIVNAFTALTSPEMHKKWGRTDGN